ncbi:MAG: hypothetical protein AB7N76_05395 [Planctomycetota bacterium]
MSGRAAPTRLAAALLAGLAPVVTGCAHSHLVASVRAPSEHAGGVAPVGSGAEELGPALLLDFDEEQPMDLVAYCGQGVSEASVWPGEGHHFRLEWLGESRYAVEVWGGDQVHVHGPDHGVRFALGGERAVLLGRDGEVRYRDGDAQTGVWKHACHGEPGGPVHGRDHGHGHDHRH